MWIKAFHVIFMVTWFAGLFYLPRLFVYHVESNDNVSHDRFVVMEKKLFIIMTIGAVLTSIFGLWMLWDYAWVAYSSSGWLHAKLTLVVLLVLYHLSCYREMLILKAGQSTRSSRYYRLYNEVPVLMLFGIVILVIVRPF